MKRQGDILEDMKLVGMLKSPMKLIKLIWRDLVLAPIKFVFGVLFFLFNPTWQAVHAFQRLMVVPIVEIVLGERSASTIFAKLFSNYYENKNKESATGTKSYTTPNFEGLNNVIAEMKMVKIITILCLILLYITAFEVLSVAYLFVAGFGAVGAFAGPVAPITTILMFIGFAVIFVVTSFLAIIAMRLIYSSIRELNKVESEDMKIFAQDSIAYIYKKAKESGKTEDADFAYNAVMYTVVLENDFVVSEVLDNGLKLLEQGAMLTDIPQIQQAQAPVTDVKPEQVAPVQEEAKA
jgi:hypothetical protein